ncbi:MAG: gluconokinase [Betaproteobacteria bacterium]|jgi:gluconokinase|nr:gluconokinase [Betaproteobacteria bacterium]
MIVLVMGVSGSGKNTIGEPLAQRLGWKFIDADDYHPPENVKKMAAGTPLQDADRWPWLDRLNGMLRNEKDAVVACSALKEAYRQRLLAGIGAFAIVYLRGSFGLIGSRVEARRHRYMPASLLRSQFDTLEPPARAIEVDVALDPDANVTKIVAALRDRS